MSEAFKIKTLALVGTPNCGKTTLYNWLTASNYKTVNYPGATVEYSLGSLAAHLHPGSEASSGASGSAVASLRVMDTPGTYSLHPKSLDEKVTLKALYQNPEFGQVDAIAVVVDGTQLERHLLLARQIQETGFPMIIIVTMADLLRKQNLKLNIEIMKKAFSCPVIEFDGVMGGGLKEIVAEVRLLEKKQPAHEPEIWSEQKLVSQLKDLQDLVKKTQHVDGSQANAEDLKLKKNRIIQRTARIDRYLLHPQFGLLLFFLIMSLLFTSIYWMASPFMDAIDTFFSQSGEWVHNHWGDGLLASFIADGVLASFGSVFVFVPQIFILFFGIGLLESTGYLARAATLIDKPFSKLGMSGRSFVPVLSGFACAVPAIMASRNIASKRDRMITTLIIPLMTCSARLPVYALLMGFVFRNQASWKAGFGLAALYMGALIIGSLAAAALNRILSKHGDFSHFLMELPLYRIPKFKVLLHQVINKTSGYIRKAGPVIFFFAVVIWFGTNFPNYHEADKAVKIESSYLGQIGSKIEPIFTPMGADWRVGIGLMSAFAAREVFVSSLAVVLGANAEGEEGQQQALLDKMAEAKRLDGQLLFSLPSVLALCVFFMIALQCISTFAIVIREMGSWKLALGQLLGLNLFAYVLAILVYQIGMIL